MQHWDSPAGIPGSDAASMLINCCSVWGGADCASFWRCASAVFMWCKAVQPDNTMKMQAGNRIERSSGIYHPILAANHDAETIAIGKFQQIFQCILASRALGQYFESKPLALNHDLELDPQENGTFTTRLRPWNT